MIHSLSVNPDFSEDTKEEIIKIKAEIVEIDIQIAKDNSVDEEFAEFANFALDYTEDLRKKWWNLPGEKLNECKHLIFRNKIIVQPNGNVYTPDLSYIYTLENENDDPKVTENQNMVEHLKINAPLLITEIRRLRHYIWDDYIETQQLKKHSQLSVLP